MQNRTPWTGCAAASFFKGRIGRLAGYGAVPAAGLLCIGVCLFGERGEGWLYFIRYGQMDHAQANAKIYRSAGPNMLLLPVCSHLFPPILKAKQGKALFHSIFPEKNQKNYELCMRNCELNLDIRPKTM